MGGEAIRLSVKDFRVEHLEKSVIIEGWVERVREPKVKKVSDKEIVDFQEIVLEDILKYSGKVSVHLEGDLVGKIEPGTTVEILGKLKMGTGTIANFYVEAERILSVEETKELL